MTESKAESFGAFTEALDRASAEAHGVTPPASMTLPAGVVQDQGDLHSSVGHAAAGAVVQSLVSFGEPPTPRAIYEGARLEPDGSLTLGVAPEDDPRPPHHHTSVGFVSNDAAPAAAIDPLEVAAQEENLAASAAVLDEIDAISEASGVGVEDLAQAFLTLRPELSSDDQVLEVLQSVARQAPEMGLSAAALAAVLVDTSKKPEGREPTPRLYVPAERPPLVLPASQTPYGGHHDHHPGRIVVLGGTRSPALPPARVLDGTPDPEIGRMVGAGRARYHLDTLDELEAESRAPTPEMRHVSRGIRLGGALALSVAAVAMMGATMPEDDAPRARGPRPAPPPRPVFESAPGADVGAPAGCRSAGCRTLADCLCTCRKCEIACHHRKA